MIAVAAWTTLLNLLGADRYSAHALCLSNDRIIMTLFASANLMTWASYTAIGFCLLRYGSRIVRISYQTKILFGTFILLCGMHHACEVFVVFAGVYRLELMVDMLMGGVSAGTAVFVVRELPKSFEQYGAAG